MLSLNLKGTSPLTLREVLTTSEGKVSLNPKGKCPLQQRREKPHEGFRKTFAQRPFQPNGRRNMQTLLNIIHENPPHLHGKFTLINKSIDLKIVFQTSKIHIGRTNTCHCIITHNQFGM